MKVVQCLESLKSVCTLFFIKSKKYKLLLTMVSNVYIVLQVTTAISS